MPSFVLLTLAVSAACDADIGWLQRGLTEPGISRWILILSRLSTLATALLVLTLLPSCQSVSSIAGQSAVEQLAMQNAMRTDQPGTMSDAERDRVLEDAKCAQNVAPAVGVANLLGGLDPTGLTQTTVQSAAMRCAAKIQANMPALIEDGRARADQYCKANSHLMDCIELRGMEAKARGLQG